ncbi:MAG: cold shock domain-containing protein [Pseudomonadota bacterium]
MQRVTGKIKWFDATKGFGFVIADTDGGDILLHANVLFDFGVSSTLEGSSITCEVVETSRGLQVSEILALDAPLVDPVDILAEILPEGTDVLALLAQDTLAPARVKWFDKGKGFGFLNVFGMPDDIFVHAEVMRAYGLADVDRGEALAVKYTDGPRGLIVIEIRQWDEALGRK